MFLLYFFIFLIYFVVLLAITHQKLDQKYYLWGGFVAFLAWIMEIILISIWETYKYDSIMNDSSLQNPTDKIGVYENYVFWLIIVSFLFLHTLFPLLFKHLMTKTKPKL